MHNNFNNKHDNDNRHRTRLCSRCKMLLRPSPPVSKPKPQTLI